VGEKLILDITTDQELELVLSTLEVATTIKKVDATMIIHHVEEKKTLPGVWDCRNLLEPFRKVISRIHARAREALFLHLDGHTAKESARLMGIGTSTVTQYLSQARKELDSDQTRQIFRQRGITWEA